jgi:hypothetical protein
LALWQEQVNASSGLADHTVRLDLPDDESDPDVARRRYHDPAARTVLLIALYGSLVDSGRAACHRGGRAA